MKKEEKVRRDVREGERGRKRITRSLRIYGGADVNAAYFRADGKLHRMSNKIAETIYSTSDWMNKWP